MIFLFFPLTRVVGLCRRGVCFLVVGCNVCLGFFLWHPSYLLHESKEEFCGKRGEAAYLFGWYYLPKWMLLVVSVTVCGVGLHRKCVVGLALSVGVFRCCTLVWSFGRTLVVDVHSIWTSPKVLSGLDGVYALQVGEVMLGFVYFRYTYPAMCYLYTF